MMADKGIEEAWDIADMERRVCCRPTPNDTCETRDVGRGGGEVAEERGTAELAIVRELLRLDQEPTP